MAVLTKQSKTFIGESVLADPSQQPFVGKSWLSDKGNGPLGDGPEDTDGDSPWGEGGEPLEIGGRSLTIVSMHQIKVDHPEKFNN